MRDAQGSAATVIQRFASGLRLNLHFHTLLLDGVFHLDERGALVFTPLPAPTDDDIADLVITIRHRILRMLRRRGMLDDDNPPQPRPAVLCPFTRRPLMLLGRYPGLGNSRDPSSEKRVVNAWFNATSSSAPEWQAHGRDGFGCGGRGGRHGGGGGVC